MATNSRLPETLTAAQRAQQLAANPTDSTMPAKPAPNDRMLRALSLDSGASAAAHRAIEQAQSQSHRDDELDGTMMTINVEDIHTYDKDPRTGTNPKYAEIKASLLAQGNHHRFAVTRRPGDERYFVAAGGNTRLRIIKELWETTGDKRWRTLDVVYRKWRSETSVIVAHLAENEARGDTSFWEKARGIASLRAELIDETGETPTATSIVDTLRKSGMERGLRYVQNALFTVDVLGPIGPFLGLASINEQLAPIHRALVRLGASTLTGSPDTTQVLHDCMVRIADRLGEAPDPSLDPKDVVTAWHLALSKRLDVTLDALHAMLTAQRDDPRVAAEVLLALGRGEPVAQLDGRAALAPAPSAAPVPLTTAHRAATDHAPLPAPQQGLLQPILSAVTPQGLVTPGGAAAAADPDALPPVESLDGPLPPHVAPEHALAYRVGALEHHVLAVLAKLMREAELDGLIVPLVHCPLGFWMEPPRQGFELNAAGAPVHDPLQRRAVWLALANLSGQFERSVVARLPEDQEVCQWRVLVEQKLLDTFLTRGMVSDDQGVWSAGFAASGAHVHEAFMHAQIGPLLLELLALAHRQRALGSPRWIDLIDDNVAAGYAPIA